MAMEDKRCLLNLRELKSLVDVAKQHHCQLYEHYIVDELLRNLPKKGKRIELFAINFVKYYRVLELCDESYS